MVGEKKRTKGKIMKNVMVCVTQQRTCDRLIRFGNEFLGKNKGELFIIHVAHYEFKFLGNSEEGEALEYLYQKAMEYGANLTVVRSNHVLDTLVELVEKNKISQVVLGQSGENSTENSLIDLFREKIKDKAELIVIPAE